MNESGAKARSPSGGSIVFLSYDPNVPSFRYRLAPAIDQLREMGWPTTVLRLPSRRYGRRLFAIRAALSDASAVVVAKINLTPPEPWMLRNWSRRVAFDIDDAIYLRRPRAPGLPPGDSWWRRHKFASTCSASDLVIAGNETLAKAAAMHSKRVEIVPTPVNLRSYRIAEIDPARPPTLVWVGRPENLDYLEMIRPSLVKLARRWPNLRLRIVCSEFPPWHDVNIERVLWSPENEIEALATADVGLMPLADDEWTRGKCAFKLLQYAAAGLCCVASNVGANRKAVVHGASGFLADTPDDWENALATLLASPDLRTAFGRRGRKHIEACYDATVVSRRTAGLLADLAA
jgi:glycosyltransferase involved in cell wall biosynthesis